MAKKLSSCINVANNQAHFLVFLKSANGRHKSSALIVSQFKKSISLSGITWINILFQPCPRGHSIIFFKAVPSTQLAEPSLSIPLRKYPRAKSIHAPVKINLGICQSALLLFRDKGSPVGIKQQAKSNQPI